MDEKVKNTIKKLQEQYDIEINDDGSFTVYADEDYPLTTEIDDYLFDKRFKEFLGEAIGLHDDITDALIEAGVKEPYVIVQGKDGQITPDNYDDYQGAYATLEEVQKLADWADVDGLFYKLSQLYDEMTAREIIEDLGFELDEYERRRFGFRL